MMLFRQSLLTLLPLAAIASDGRLGSTLVNFETVGKGRTFTSAPQPDIDRVRLLRELNESNEVRFDSEAIYEDVSAEESMETVGEGKVFSEPISRKLRRINGEKRATKESFRDQSIPVLEKAIDNDRNLQDCADDQKYFKIDLTTDNYGFENSWTLKRDGELIQKGPPSSSSYDDNTRYVGGFCLDAGSYELSVKDQYKDGMCCSSGQGSYEVYIDGSLKFSSPNGDNIEEDWSQRDHTFTISENDQTQSDDSIVSTYEDTNTLRSSRCQNVKIEITVDKYGKETSIYFKNKSTGKSVLSSVKEIDDYGTQTISDCISPGTYTLLLQDIDGLCCKNGKGGYKLSIDGTDVLDGGYFVKSKSHIVKIGYNWRSSMDSRAQDWLSSHNSRRTTYHQKEGKSPRALRWSSTLANDALKWSKQLLSSCSSSGISHQDGVNDGENLAKNKGAGEWGSQYDTDNILKRWVENEDNLSYPHNAHLTQVIWYSSSYVGCGESLKKISGQGTCRIQVCRYARPGNCNVKNGNWRSEAFKDETGCGEPCPTEGCFV